MTHSHYRSKLLAAGQHAGIHPTTMTAHFIEVTYGSKYLIRPRPPCLFLARSLTTLLYAADIRRLYRRWKSWHCARQSLITAPTSSRFTASTRGHPSGGLLLVLIFVHHDFTINWLVSPYVNIRKSFPPLWFYPVVLLHVLCFAALVMTTCLSGDPWPASGADWGRWRKWEKRIVPFIFFCWSSRTTITTV